MANSLLNREITFSRALNDKFKASFFTELSNLLSSGIDIRRSLQLLIEEQTKDRIKKVIEEIQKDVIGGYALFEALERTKEFSLYEYQTIRIGEETGQLNKVIDHLADYFDSRVKLKRQLISVFTYPTFVLLITFGVVYFMLNSVVPMFEGVFQQFGQELPYLTQKIISLSKGFSSYGTYIFIGVLGLIIILYTQRKEEWYRKASSTLLIKFPAFGPLFKRIYVARMCQSMSLLISSKTPLVESLELVKDMINFYPIENALESIKKEVVKGASLNVELAKYTIFDTRLISMVKIAEETNSLDKTFERLSKQYQEDIEHKTKLLGTIIEPLIIVLIGGIVGTIMVAMYLPMFNLSNVIK